MGNSMSKLAPCAEEEIASLFDSIPAEFMSDYGGEGCVSLEGLNWLIRNTPNRELRRLLVDVKQALESALRLDDETATPSPHDSPV